jgi:hypothetical protein
LNDVDDVAGVEPVTLACFAVRHDADIGLAHRRELAEVRDAADVLQDLEDDVGVLLVLQQVVAEHLDRVLTLDPGERFLDVVADHLREVECDRRELRMKIVVDLVDQLVLGEAARKVVEWDQRREELDIEEARDVGAVIRPAELRGRDQYLRVLLYRQDAFEPRVVRARDERVEHRVLCCRVRV